MDNKTKLAMMEIYNLLKQSQTIALANHLSLLTGVSVEHEGKILMNGQVGEAMNLLARMFVYIADENGYKVKDLLEMLGQNIVAVAEGPSRGKNDDYRH